MEATEVSLRGDDYKDEDEEKERHILNDGFLCHNGCYFSTEVCVDVESEPGVVAGW